MKVSYQFLMLALGFALSAQFVSTQTKTAKATFAGGCYWCMEEVFDRLKGVVSATSGFTGSHVEAVEVLYDPEKITYEKLLDVFWKNIDPIDRGGQFCDRGPQYRSGIFYFDEEQKALAEKSKAEIEKFLNHPVDTPVLQATAIVASKEQDFYKTNFSQYKQYKLRCERDRRLKELWGTKKSNP
jgi:peptide-methionine (S)-S-oxide reductase